MSSSSTSHNMRPASEQGDESPENNKRRSILVVDDDIVVRKALKHRLEQAGYRVRAAADGLAGVTLFDEHGADLIILDIKMPDMDGFEVCEAIRRDHDVPIIFLTGVQDSLIVNYLPQMVDAAGGDYYLRKPFDPESLIKLIREVLQQD